MITQQICVVYSDTPASEPAYLGALPFTEGLAAREVHNLFDKTNTDFQLPEMAVAEALA